MPQEKKKESRDYPLAPTPAIKDNTFVGKPSAQWEITEGPSYKYVEANVMTTRGGKPYSKKDSLLYKEGFDQAIQDKTYPTFHDQITAGRLEGSERKKPKLYKK